MGYLTPWWRYQGILGWEARQQYCMHPYLQWGALGLGFWPTEGAGGSGLRWWWG